MIRRALLMWIAVGPLAAEVRDLKVFFQERCAACHGVDATGRGPGGVRLSGRNLAEGRWLAKQADSDLATSILKGRGAMPGFRRQLSEVEAQKLVKELIRKAEKGKLIAPSGGTAR